VTDRRESPRPRIDRPTLELRDGVVLLAPGGAFLPSEQTLIVADTHAGLPLELRARGHAVPVGDDEALYAKVRAMLSSTRAKILLVAGDLAHGAGSGRRALHDGRSPIESFVGEFSNGPSNCTLRVVLGNHDKALSGALSAMGVECGESLRVGPHVVVHGDEVDRVRALRAEAIERGGRAFVGHVHPALALDDGAGARRVCPAFVSARGLLCLPALSVWARGGDVRSRPVRAQLEALADGDPMGVAVIVGDRVLPIGAVFGD
jgi:putative SbcD/Mre11-related phosphoesterase